MKTDGSMAGEASRGRAAASGGVARRHVAGRLGGAIFFSLLSLIALVAIPYGTIEPWWQTLFECAVFGLAALWVWDEFTTGGAWNVSAYSLLWPLVALCLFGLLQTIPTGTDGAVSLKVGGVWQAVSADPHGTRRWVSKMAALILVCAMLLRYVSDERRLRVLVHVLIGIAALSAVFGLVRQMTQHEVGFVLPYLKPGFGYAQFINKNHFPFLMEMALGLVLGLTLGGGVGRDRLLIYAALGLLFGGALVSANSRGGILSLLCQLLFAALLFSVVRRARDAQSRNDKIAALVRRVGGSMPARILLIVCLVIVVGVGIVWVGGDTLVGSLEALPSEVGAPVEGNRWAVRRKDIWPATWQLIKEHPLVGSGFGGYWMAITRYHQGSGEMTPQEAHNDYLEFLASGGLIGLAFGCWFLFAFVGRAREQLRAPDAFRRSAAFGALVGLAGVSVHSVVDFGLHVTVNAVAFIALVVIATVSVRMNDELKAVRGQ